MYFTLAVSADTPARCAALTDRARVADPAVMPVPGPPTVVWRAPDGRAVMLRWGGSPGDESVLGKGLATTPAPAATPATSHAGTIWAGHPTPGSGRAPVYARTSVTRVDPVYVAEVPGAVILSDRATWAAWTAGKLGDHDPLHICALLNPGYPLGSATPFRGVSALSPSTVLHLVAGTLTRTPNPENVPGRHSFTGARAVAAALVEALAPLREAGQPVQLSLTGGKDSRLVAAALVAARVPVQARTHGFDGHPDVVLAARIADRLGIEHIVVAPAAPGQRIDVAARIRATVLVADGMLSAFENVGRPDPAMSPTVTAGGHGGELLRGGYAETAAGPPASGSHAAHGGHAGHPGHAGHGGGSGGLRAVVAPARRAVRAAELLRRLTTRHAGLLRRGTAASYVASLAPWTAALARGPLQALDDFYLLNRAGRWSAAARQAYLIRESLVQPLFDEQVVLAARSVPLADRISGELSRAVLAHLCPALADIPLAGKAAAEDGSAAFDWRRQYGTEIASFLREYTLDLGASGGLFDVVSRPAAERLLTPPHADRPTVWALATLACLVSADYRNARTPSPHLSVT
jgi:asparagine synthase (glutamine-hydrolysing)